MPSKNGSRTFLEVSVGFVKATDEHRLLASQVKDHRDRAVPCRLNHGLSQPFVMVEIVLGVAQLLSFQEVLQRSAVAAKVPGVDEKIRFRGRCVLEYHVLGHVCFQRHVAYNALSGV